MEDKIGTREYIFLGMLCFLLIFSGVQAIQVEKIEEGMQEFSVESPVAQGPAAATAPQPQAQMVGGC